MEEKVFMYGFKGYNPGLTCMNKQYEENTVFEEPDATICEKGMHFCKNPFDVWLFYGPVNTAGEFNEFTEVYALDEALTDDNTKFCTRKLKVGKKLSFKDFIDKCIEYVHNIVNGSDTGSDCGARIWSSGDSAKIGSSGNYAKIGSSGDSAQIGSSGNYAKIGSSGDSAQIWSSGDSAQIGSSGNYAKIGSSGEDSVICCAGRDSCVKAKRGSWITLAEWCWCGEKRRYIPKCVKTEYVDGERIKEDTFYKLVNGEFIECVRI